MPIKDFDQVAASLREKKNSEGSEFMLGGVEFKTIPYLTTGDFISFSRMHTVDDPLYYFKFLEKYVVDEQVADFDEIISDPNNDYPQELIIEIINWITSEQAKRPLKRSKSSTKSL